MEEDQEATRVAALMKTVTEALRGVKPSDFARLYDDLLSRGQLGVSRGREVLAAIKQLELAKIIRRAHSQVHEPEQWELAPPDTDTSAA